MTATFDCTECGRRPGASRAHHVLISRAVVCTRCWDAPPLVPEVRRCPDCGESLNAPPLTKRCTPRHTGRTR